ncbi:MAG: DegT/DnrJ/EryC1/StrS family aminotransferase [Planctomycetota bacterium]
MNESVNGVPLLDLKAQYSAIGDEVREAINRVLESQRFILGPEVKALEDEIAEYCNCRYAVGVSSGTDALLVALMAIDVKAGDEVITTPYSFFATAGVVHRLGATPVFVDIEPDTYNINPELIESAITPRTKAVIPVHLFGQCAEMEPVLKIAERHGLKVIEDAAQAIGAEYKGRRAGSMGDIGCFSFFPSENLGACGDGGMVTTNDKTLAGKMHALRVHGAEPKYYHQIVGGNFRLDAVQAAVLRVKLRHLDEWSEARQKNAADYDRRLTETGLAGKKVILPTVRQNRHIFNQYVLRVKNRDGLITYLRDEDAGCEVYYPVPLHLQKCFSYLGLRKGAFPESERAAESTLAIPIYPELTEAQRAYVVDKIASFYR